MAVVLVMNFKGVSQKNYDNVCTTLNFPAEIPDGLIFHGAGSTSEGFCVVDCWESQAHFDRFFESKLGPACQKEGVPQPETQTIQTYRTVSGKTPVGTH